LPRQNTRRNGSKFIPAFCKTWTSGKPWVKESLVTLTPLEALHEGNHSEGGGSWAVGDCNNDIRSRGLTYPTWGKGKSQGY